MDQPRRDLLTQLAGGALASASATVAAAADAPSAPDPGDGGPAPGPAMTRGPLARRTPGKPGDFDFLSGRWRIANLKRRDGAWDRFDGEATVHGLLDGVCSVEELRIPARQFSGMGLRLLDRERGVWVDHWVNARSGVLGLPGMDGSFEDGAGLFESEETENGVRVLYRSVWDRISPAACRWQQGASRDGGRSWQLDWSMDWTRLA